MSATNSTTTIGLSQYISTDKPTYLTDYNDDMLRIDNAIASDRDGISTAQNKANTADGKADANKTSIDTLNEQINGDPTATPPTTGIAGKVTTIESAVNSLSSLMGNGHPTTSDQTVIGAINNIEDTVAPSEDGITLGADYDTGKQFMRGGELYEALVDLTSGTAFSALTLNTDYKVADRLVKQIDDAVQAIETVNGNLRTAYRPFSSDVQADGVKTVSQILDALFAEFKSKVVTGKLYSLQSAFCPNVPITLMTRSLYVQSGSAIVDAGFWAINSNLTEIYFAQIKTSGSVLKKVAISDGTVTDLSSAVPSEGANFSCLAVECLP